MLILLLFISIISYSQSYNDLKLINNENDFKRVMIESNYQFDKNDDGYILYGYGLVKDSIEGNRSEKWGSYNTETGGWVLQINNIDDGQRLVLNKVLFHQSSDQLLDESYVQLEMIINILINNKNLSVFLEGHTDNIGNPNKNLELSNKRVNQVMKYLIDKGIDKNRMNGKGYGSDRPLVKTNSLESRKMNRRVEIIFNKKSN